MKFLLNPAQVAEKLGVARSTVARMVADGRIPAPIYIGPHSPRWREADIDEWIDSLGGGQ